LIECRPFLFHTVRVVIPSILRAFAPLRFSTTYEISPPEFLHPNVYFYWIKTCPLSFNLQKVAFPPKPYLFAKQVDLRGCPLTCNRIPFLSGYYFYADTNIPTTSIAMLARSDPIFLTSMFCPQDVSHDPYFLPPSSAEPQFSPLVNFLPTLFFFQIEFAATPVGLGFFSTLCFLRALLDMCFVPFSRYSFLLQSPPLIWNSSFPPSFLLRLNRPTAFGPLPD